MNRYVLLASIVVTLAAGIAVYEWIGNVRYGAWKADFDNHGALDRLTVPSPNEILMWEYKPYGHYQNQWQTIETNRYGFRDEDYSTPTKPDGVHRIAFVGDLITLGLLVTPEQTFVSQFEALAVRTSPTQTVQALNFGIDGYTGVQIVELIRAKVLDFVPDQIVYVFCLNGFDFDDASGDKILYFRKPSSFLLTDIRRISRRFQGLEYHLYHFQRTRDIVFREVLQIHQLLYLRGIDFHVVIVPTFGPDPEHFVDYPHTQIHEEITNFLNEHQIPTSDLFEPIAQSGVPVAELAFDLWHPTPRGHRLIAESLVLPLCLMTDNTVPRTQ